VRAEPRRADALERPRQPGRARAVFLAVLVHALFFALIVFGVTWQSTPAPPLEAQLWDKLPAAKPASKAETRKPTPQPPPKPEPKPKPEPTPPPPDAGPLKPAHVTPPPPDPQIAERLAREKAEQERREKVEREKAARLEQEKRERLDKQKAEDAKRKRVQEEAAKKKQEDDQRVAEEARVKAEAERAHAAAITAQQAQINGFVEDIKRKIRGRANVPDSVTGKPTVTFRIRILPGGDVLDITLVKPSGNPVYDTAIERAIRSAQPLPVPPANSELFPQFRNLILNIEHDR